MPRHAVRRVLQTTIKAATLRGVTKPGLGHRLIRAVHDRIDRADRIAPLASDRTHRRPHPLPPDNFKHSLTLFSKSFSSLLAVLVRHRSRPYLALTEFTARLGLHSQTTRLVDSACGATGSGTTGSHLSGAPFQGTWARSVAEDASQTTIQRRRRPIFKLGSSRSPPLLRESLTLGHRASDRTTDDITRLEFTTACRDAPGALSSDFGQPRAVTHGDQLPPHILERMGTTICDTQADVPRPEGLGRNLRSKTRWFTDSAIHTKYRISPRSSSMRAEISAAESRFRLYIAALLPNKHRLRLAKALFSCMFLDTFRAGLVKSGSYARTIRPRPK
ncbi:hypothetical protein Bca4012_103132 [Brassica carinata]